MALFHAVCCILYAVSTQLSVVVCPGNQTVTLPWLGCLDSGCLWWDPGIHWNSKQSPIPPKIIKMDPWGFRKTAKCCPEWSLKPSKSWKHRKCGTSRKPLHLLYFWKVGTLENHSFSIQKSSKNMPAMQIMFFTLQISEYIKKWLKMDSNWGPIIHQKSSQIYLGTHKWPPECILAPLGHQNASKETSTGPNVMPKWCQRGRRQGAKPLNIYIVI